MHPESPAYDTNFKSVVSNTPVARPGVNPSEPEPRSDGRRAAGTTTAVVIRGFH